jgi:hypothetical protein
MDVTIAVNAAPMTTATARSMTLPRRMNSLKPFTLHCLAAHAPQEDEVDGALDGVAAGLEPPSDFVPEEEAPDEEDDDESLFDSDFDESLDFEESLDFDSARESFR